MLSAPVGVEALLAKPNSLVSALRNGAYPTGTRRFCLGKGFMRAITLSQFGTLIFGAFLISLAGCMPPVSKLTPTAPGSIAAVSRASEHGLEVSATPEDQARQDILNTPTVFTVGFEDDPYSWERAKFFLEKYAGGGAGHSSVVTRIVGNRLSLASNPAATDFSYEVSKDPTEGGFNYHVACSAAGTGDNNQAALNAGNLARFIRDGKLELSLLEKKN